LLSAPFLLKVERLAALQNALHLQAAAATVIEPTGEAWVNVIVQPDARHRNLSKGFVMALDEW
jgi:hypothetical protein